MYSKDKQLSITDVFNNLDSYFEQDKPKLITLFKQHIDLQSLIPQSFYTHYYASTGHPRQYPLSSMLCALILKSMLSIADTSLFLNLLSLCSELRELCGFTKIPHPSQFTRFKMDFQKDIESFFNHLVSLTEPLCKEINPFLSSILITDTTGFEAYVTENNPRYFDSILRTAKKSQKNNPKYNAHSFACSKMPKVASSNPDIQLSYLNSHYGYYLKTAFTTNALGIIRHVDFYDDPSLDITSSSSPQEHKDDYDAKSLIPVLKNYFSLHPSFSYKYFLGDAGFDAVDNYKFLVKDKGIIPIIPLRKKPSIPPGFNESGIPTCPYNTSLPMKYDGIGKQAGRAARIKWLCPKCYKGKDKNNKTTYTLSCDNPCTTSKCGKIYNVPIHNNYRLYTAVPRDSEKWIKLYKLRTIIERTNFMVKYPMSLHYTKLRDIHSLKSEIFIAAIVQQIVVLIAYATSSTKHILSVKQFIA